MQNPFGRRTSMAPPNSKWSASCSLGRVLWAASTARSPTGRYQCLLSLKIAMESCALQQQVGLAFPRREVLQKLQRAHDTSSNVREVFAHCNWSHASASQLRWKDFSVAIHCGSCYLNRQLIVSGAKWLLL